jgi:hypothetical protein
MQELEPGKAYLSSPGGLLPVDSDGMRVAVDAWEYQSRQKCLLEGRLRETLTTLRGIVAELEGFLQHRL